MEIEFNENRDLCKKCGGVCCKKFGCEIFPEDVIKRYGEISEETLCQLINTGYVSIDYWMPCKDPNKSHPKKEMYDGDAVHFLRMRHTDNSICGPSAGPCKALTKNGCMLDWDNRPTGGKLLIPYPGRMCRNLMEEEFNLSSDTELAALMWFEYNSLLEKLYYKYSNL